VAPERVEGRMLTRSTWYLPILLVLGVSGSVIAEDRALHARLVATLTSPEVFDARQDRTDLLTDELPSGFLSFSTGCFDNTNFARVVLNYT
jgi:hypothetical protein